MGETTAWPLPNVPYASCFFLPQFLSLMASSLSYSVGGTHTHTAYLPNLGILLAPPLIFTKYIAFILFNSRVYRSHSTVQRTKYCLVGGIHNPVRWKKGDRCTAFATRHEEQLSQKEETTILYTPF